MEKVLKELVKNVKDNIPGYIAISVAEMASGESLISDSIISGFDPVLASAFNVEIIHSKRNAMKTLGLTNEKINDITFNLSEQTHVINLSPTGEYFIYLAVNSKKANVALTRTLLNKYKKDLIKQL